MARSLEQISTDLAKLDTATQKLDQDLQVVYRDYLNVLGQAVKRQLILAAYHLCTQTYPDDFLTLTVSQREKLQAHLRQIATQGEAQIIQLGQMSDLKDLAAQIEEAVVAKYGAIDSDDLDEMETESTDDLDEIDADSTEVDAVPEESPLPPPEATMTADEGNEPPLEATAPDLTSEESASDVTAGETSATAESTSAILKRLGNSLSLFSILGTEPLTPVSLAKRHVLLERHLRAILSTLSGLANHLLKQAEILPDLPEMVIAAAAEADGEDAGPSIPNLVSVLVAISDRPEDEADDQVDDENDELEEEDADHAMTHLVAINLRLADIEFADHHTALWRGRLQETLLKLKRLGSRYQKLQQEKSRAEAEHAWRAIWFEE